MLMDIPHGARAGGSPCCGLLGLRSLRPAQRDGDKEKPHWESSLCEELTQWGLICMGLGEGAERVVP